MRTKEFWAVMPARGNRCMTKAALDDLLAQDIGTVRPVVIVNGADDGVSPLIHTYGRSVTALHYYPSHPGVAFAWNRGLEYAFANGAEFAFVVNNDVRLRLDMMRLLAADGGAFVTGVGVAPEDYDPTPRRPDPERRRPHPDFSGFLIRRECWEKVGSFDEGYLGSYCEDWNYHVRMHRAGITAISIDLPFLHYAAQTIKSQPDGGAAMSAQAERNRKRFLEQFGVEGGTEAYYALFGTGAPE